MKNHKCARKYKQWMFVLALFSRILVSEVVCSENSVKSKIQVTRVSQVTTSDKDNPKPISYLNDSVDDDHHTYELIGSGFNSDTDFFLLPTPSQDTCIVSSQTLPAIKINKGSSNDSLLYVSFKTNHFLHANQFYLCCFFDELLNDGHHLGNSSLFVMASNKSLQKISRALQPKKKRQVSLPVNDLIIDGFRIEHSDKEPEIHDGVLLVRAGAKITLRLFGTGITANTQITFSAQAGSYGALCELTTKTMAKVLDSSVDSKSALVVITLPQEDTDDSYYICAKNEIANDTGIKANFVHQGSYPWLILKSYQPLLPLWVQIIIILVCLCFSALFSGLNLGLMSLDRTDLKILCNTGSEAEKRYARAIQPVRDHGNFLLCSILLGNVLVNSTFTILLDSLTSGLIAIVFSTLLIVVFGEITPQAICSRHGLAVGARTIMITKFIMFVTFPLSYPTSKLLDCLLGEEIGNFYNRERLKELVKVTTDVNDLDKDEVNIISGVLELRKKTVGDVQTHIEDAYMLPLDSILDFETISEIMKSGFSRIPVYDGDRKNIVTLLYIKDLAFVDTDDNTPLRTLCEFYQNPCHFVFDDLTLDIMFRQFKEGHKGHMAFVHRVNNDGEGDPFYETVGLVTLEDVIEELIQSEIMDETDVFTDNRTKVRRLRPKKQDFSIFAERRAENNKVRVSPQLQLATYQYLHTTVDAFKSDIMSETILRRLLNQDIVKAIKCKGKEKTDASLVLFQQGKPVDFFALILEGRVEVTVGRENLVFEGGPFTYFGTQALVQSVGVESPQQVQQQIMGSLQSLNIDALLRHTFIPDYSVRAVTDVVYLVIKRSLHMAAKRATLMEKAQRAGEPCEINENDEEVEKLLHSLDEDDFHESLHHNNPQALRTSRPASIAPSPTSNMMQPNGSSTSQRATNSPQPENSNGTTGNVVTFGGNRSQSIGYVNHKQTTDPDDSGTPLLPRSKS